MATDTWIDQLAKGLAGARSRRELLKLTAAAAVGFLVSRPTPVAAAGHCDPPCPDGEHCDVCYQDLRPVCCPNGKFCRVCKNIEGQIVDHLCCAGDESCVASQCC